LSPTRDKALFRLFTSLVFFNHGGMTATPEAWSLFTTRATGSGCC
jgi:hypothetical protein